MRRILSHVDNVRHPGSTKRDSHIEEWLDSQTIVQDMAVLSMAGSMAGYAVSMT